VTDVAALMNSDSLEAVRVLDALRASGGSATLGDIASATGLPIEAAREALNDLLEARRGHLEVGESGDVVYRFDKKLLRRDRQPFWDRMKQAGWKAFTQGFKAWIVIMLVGYFLVFVALAIAALLAASRGGGGRSRLPRRRGGRMPIPSFWIWYFFWTPRWRLGRPYYGHRWEVSRGKENRVPFYKKVFAFVFGPDVPNPTREQLDRSTVRLIRARQGVITTAELVQHSGLPVPEAEEEMGRLTGAYSGEVQASREGELVYSFPELMVSAKGKIKVRPPNPAWRRLESSQLVTGNSAGANAGVAGINAFTLVAAATAPLFIFPQLQIGGTLAYWGLVYVPVIFSALFFSVPLVRWMNVKRENRRRAHRNLRKVVLGFVYEAALTNDYVTAEVLAAKVEQALEASVSPAQVTDVLHELAAEFDADVAPAADGTLEFRFPSVLSQFVAGRDLRKSLKLDERKVGDIVYSSADTNEEASRRELEGFDRELAGLIEAPGRVDYEEAYDLIEFDEELARRREATRH
jgi:DNA-binding transcriptional ArsR family regulator